MSASPIDGYLTKKEIEESFDRSHRSLTRDFSNAVRVGDSKFFRTSNYAPMMVMNLLELR